MTETMTIGELDDETATDLPSRELMARLRLTNVFVGVGVSAGSVGAGVGVGVGSVGLNTGSILGL